MKRPIIAVAVATTLVLAGPVITVLGNNSLPRRFKFAAVEAGHLCWFFRGHWTQSRADGPIDRFTGKVRCVGTACIARRAVTNLNFGPEYFAGSFEGPIKFSRNNTGLFRRNIGGGCRFVQSSPGATHYNCWLNTPAPQPSTGEGSFQIELPPVTPCRVTAP